LQEARVKSAKISEFIIGVPIRTDASYDSEGMATSAVMGLVVTVEHLRHCFTMPAQVKGVTGYYS
jgi:hypothetical protein